MNKTDILRVLGTAVQPAAYESLKGNCANEDINFILNTLPNSLFRAAWDEMRDLIEHGAEVVDGVDYELRVQSLRNKLSDHAKDELKSDVERVEGDDRGDRTFEILLGHILSLAQ